MLIPQAHPLSVIILILDLKSIFNILLFFYSDMLPQAYTYLKLFFVSLNK